MRTRRFKVNILGQSFVLKTPSRVSAARMRHIVSVTEGRIVEIATAYAGDKGCSAYELEPAKLLLLTLINVVEESVQRGLLPSVPALPAPSPLALPLAGGVN